MEKLEIPLSKTKLTFTFILSLLFVAAGVLLTTGTIDNKRLSPAVLVAVGIVSIAFFGYAAYRIAKKLTSKQAGLLLDGNGITDNSSATSFGFIAWQDITAIKTAKLHGVNFLLIYVNNPDKYLSRINGKHLMVANSKLYGTPFSIASNTLKCKHSWLEQLVTESLNRHRQPNNI